MYVGMYVCKCVHSTALSRVGVRGVWCVESVCIYLHASTYYLFLPTHLQE